MQNHVKDLETFFLEPEHMRQPTESTKSIFGVNEGSVLRGNVIAESEQDLAELLSRYQQGYYRPNEASESVSVSVEHADLSRYLKTNTLGLGNGGHVFSGQEKEGRMMQLHHEPKASLLMRYPNPVAAYQTPMMHSSGWPLSFNSIVNPARNQYSDRKVLESQWMSPQQSLSSWNQGSGNLGFGVDSYSEPLYSSPLFGQDLSPGNDFPVPPQSLMISRNPGYSYPVNGGYQEMIPTPCFKSPSNWNENFSEFRCSSFPGSFLDNQTESKSAQNSMQSTQEKVNSFGCYGAEDSGLTINESSNLEFINQFLSPQNSVPIRPSVNRKSKDRKLGQMKARKQQLEDSMNTTGHHWLLETLARLPVDDHQSDNCLIWSNEPTESFLLSTENSLNGKSCSADLKSENNNQQNEVSKLLEETGLTFLDTDLDFDLSCKLSELLSNHSTSDLSREDVLELAFCTLSTTTATVEELQQVCKVWITTSAEAAAVPSKTSSLEDLQSQFQPSLDQWIGTRHAQTFSRGKRGQRSIESCLKNDKRFIQQRNNRWSCLNTLDQSLTRIQDSTLKRQSSIKRKKNEPPMPNAKTRKTGCC